MRAFSRARSSRPIARQAAWATARASGPPLRALANARMCAASYAAGASDPAALAAEPGRPEPALCPADTAPRAPLPLPGPNIPAGTFATRVLSLDLYPTLLLLGAGLDAPSDGRSLLPVLERREVAPRDVFAFARYFGAHMRAGLVGPW